ncbi:hypothetical protein ACOMHN_040357 [Nucella lapillus]
MADVPSGDGTSDSAHMADLALNLADQLISAFQQAADGTGEGEGESATQEDGGDIPSDNGAQDLETEAKDGNDEWQDLPEDDDELTEGYDNGVKEEGVGEENPPSCFSPLSQDFNGEDMETDENGMDVVFSPTKVLNFDDSDGDDLPAVEQRFVPRGVFVSDDRPELHGSEEAASYYSGPARTNMLLSGDYSQNVRIIEGHDDLDLDRGAGYMSLTMRNHFLQTQMVQLPPFCADDPNSSAHLYDSLERKEEEELYPGEDQDQEQEFDNAEQYRRGDTGRDDINDQRTADPTSLDVYFVQEDLMNLGGGGPIGQQQSRRDQDHDHYYEDGEVAGAGELGGSLTHGSQDREQQNEDALMPTAENSVGAASHAQQPGSSEVPQGAGSNLVVTLPKPSTSGLHQNQVSGDGSQTGNLSKSESQQQQQQQQPSARPKQPINKRQPRGGPAGSNGREVRNPGNRSQGGGGAGARAAADQRMNNGRAGGNRVTVGSSRQQGSGAHSQRPAVQGAAVTVAGISGGDGDGAVAGSGSVVAAAAPPNSVGGATLLSRTSSQGSLHSTTSSMGNSRVSGVGKESNSTRYNQPPPPPPRSARAAYATIPGSQDPGAASRVGPPTHQQSQRPSHHPHPHPAAPQRPPPPHHHQRQPRTQAPPPPGSNALQSSSSHPLPASTRSPPAKQKGGPHGGMTGKSVQLQQQQQQLQQEQQRLLQRQRQLQQQQQLQQQLGGMESPDGDHLMHHHQGEEAVVTQVGHMQQSEGLRQHRHNHLIQERSGGGAMATEVQGMEEVRSALQNMLRLPREVASFDHRSFDFADSASDLLMDRPPPAHYHHPEGDTSSVSGFRGQGPEEMSEMMESFPSFSFRMLSDMSTVSGAADRSLQGENAYLREHLEKERYRRKHCEQQIQHLNAKLLEVQQQLAVAVSTDKRKDIMIDQLDKQLAKVVEGWKKREAEKDEYMSMVMKEKAQIEDTLQKQQNMIDSFEKELACTVEELKQEKENSAQLVDSMKEQLASSSQSQRHAEDMLAAEKERATLMEKEWDQLKESRDLAEKRAQQAQERLHQEQDSWYQREQELVHKIDQVKDANFKVMQMERVKLEEQTRKAEEMEENVHTATTEIKRLEMEVDSAVREKESLKVEMALMEAKFESSQRTLQADLQATYEKEMGEAVSEVKRRAHQEQEEQGERHRHLVEELHQRHQRDTDQQMASLRQELSRREEDLKQQVAELETRLNESRQEISALKQAKQKLESQRLEVLNKLQVIMQSQWNEAVSLLVTTPQRKTLNTSLSSSLGGAGGGSMLAGGMLSHLSASSMAPSASSAPQFNVSSGGGQSTVTSVLPPPSAARSGRSAAGQSVQQGRSGQSSPLNNLSGSQSSHSSPPSPAHHHHHRTTTTTTITSRNSRGPAGVSKERGPPGVEQQPASFTADTGVSLQDLTALLSDGGHYLPPDVASHIHGVTHHGGLVVNTHPYHPHPPHQTMKHPHQPPPSESQAFMIRPPQQSSRSTDFSFLSDVSHHSDRSLGMLRDGGAPLAERERVQSGDSHRVQSFVAERGLELRDLEMDSNSGVRGDVLMVGGAASSAAGSRDGMNSIGSGYPPSMSPPVKQGRDGEQDSIDGGALHDTDRLNSSYREISRQLEEHQSRQRELQHYIKMLLDKPPGAASDQPERDSVTDPDAMDISFSSVVADLGLTEAFQAAQVNSELQRLQQLRDRQTTTTDQQSQSTRPKSGAAKPNSSRHPPPSSSSHQQTQSGAATAAQHPPPPHHHDDHHQGHQSGGLAPEQLAEISRLLGQYREDVEAGQSEVSLSALQANPASMSQILRFLASLPQQQGGDGEKVASTKSSPRQQTSRQTREQQRHKKQGDPRHHSVGPDTSLSSVSVATEKQDRSMASSTRSTTTTTTSARRTADRKSANNSVSSSSGQTSSASKSGTRPRENREQHQQQPPVWK